MCEVERLKPVFDRVDGGFERLSVVIFHSHCFNDDGLYGCLEGFLVSVLDRFDDLGCCPGSFYIVMFCVSF